MAQMTDLTLPVLNMIFIFLATSDDGARDLARARATCKMFKAQDLDSSVSRVVNFQRLTTVNDLTMHHHENGLLYKCAKLGNQAAQIILGKAIVARDTWFWRMILEDYPRAFFRHITPPLVLDHHSLVRKFILNATSQEIATIRDHLINYVFLQAGYNAARESGIISAISDMCSYETMKIVPSMSINEMIMNNLTFGASFDGVEFRFEPLEEAAYRDNVIVLYDKIFPFARE